MPASFTPFLRIASLAALLAALAVWSKTDMEQRRIDPWLGVPALVLGAATWVATPFTVAQFYTAGLYVALIELAVLLGGSKAGDAYMVLVVAAAAGWVAFPARGLFLPAAAMTAAALTLPLAAVKVWREKPGTMEEILTTRTVFAPQLGAGTALVLTVAML